MVYVSCVQMDSKLGDVDGNLQKMLRFIDQIMTSRKETDLIVFPELITTGYEGTIEQFQEMAETIPGGKSVMAIQEACRKYSVYVVYGLPERDSRIHSLLFNTAVMIGPDGEIVGSYRKTHPVYGEKKWCKAGDSLPIFETGFGKVGIMICWDTAFPEVARCYAMKGAELLVIATAWEKPYEDDWDLVTRARAFDNTLHVVSANRVGEDVTRGFFGHSNIIDPVGKTIATLNDDVEGVIHASLDLSVSQRLRAEYYTFFRDRQVALYGEIGRI